MCSNKINNTKTILDNIPLSYHRATKSWLHGTHNTMRWKRMFFVPVTNRRIFPNKIIW